MDALRNTLSLHSIKTRQLIYQDPSGSFPAVGGVLNVTDTQGHTDWTRDLSVNSVTLANNISGPGRLTYSNTGVLLLNGVPVGGGGGAVVGGTNISVAGSTVNFDPTKGGGVDMLTGTLGFNAGGKNSTVVFDTASTNGTLTVTNTTGTPQFGTHTGAGGPSITMSSSSTSNVNNIALVASNATDGTCSVTMNTAGSVTSGAINYTEINDKLSVTCTENLSLTATSSGQAIEMGSTLGQMIASTRDQPIVLMRTDAGGANIESLLTMDFANTIKIGESTVVGDPTLKFQSSMANAQLALDSSDQLVISGSVGVATQIATPLNDVASGGPGSAGQVLTSQGAGLPPVWAAGGGGGGGGGVVLASRTYLYAGTPHTVTLNAATFPGIPTTSPTTIRIYSQAGGGGGGGGWGLANAGGIQSGGGGGGGGAGYVQDFLLNVPYGTTVFTLTVGDGGNGGNGGNIFGSGATDGQIGGSNTITTTISVELLSYVTPGGAGGINGAGSGAGGGGDPAGDTAPVSVTGPVGGFNPGAKGGGLYGGTAGEGDNSVGIGLRNAGRGLAGAAHYSGAGGGGGGGGQGSNGEAGGKGAPGFIRIDIYSG